MRALNKQERILPDHWKQWVRDYRKKHPYDKYKQLVCFDFDGKDTLIVVFQDDSRMELKDAFYVIDKKRKEVAIFTEHFGYFVCASEDVDIISGDKKPL